MRIRHAAILLTLATGGCAATHRASPPSAREDAVGDDAQVAHYYEDAPAAALAFDPPIIIGERPLELARDERQPAAFLGYDSPITTYFWVHTDDNQERASGLGNGGAGGSALGGVNDYFQRRAVIDQVGTRTR